MVRTLFRLRMSRTTAISSASTVAKLTKSVSEALNFPPTKLAAEIILKILETIKKVDDNDEAHIKLMKRVIDFLLILRNHFEVTSRSLTPELTEKMQEFEEVLLSIRDDIVKTGKKSFKKRVLSKDKIKDNLDGHTAAIESEIVKLMLSLNLETNAVVHNVKNRINQLDVGVQPEGTGERSLVLRRSTMLDPGEEFWEELRSNYVELPVGEIFIEGPVFENAVVSFANLSYACVKGERRLIKWFNGEDEGEKQVVPFIFSKELLCSSDVTGVVARAEARSQIEMQGFSKRNSTNLYVLFHNTQVRCLATCILELLQGSMDIPSVASNIGKMINTALDAIKYSANVYHLNKAESSLVAQNARFALDSGNNLIVSLSPRSPQDRVNYSLMQSLCQIFWPPLRDSGMDRYFTGLAATHISLGSKRRNVSERRAAVYTFLEDHGDHDELVSSFMLNPTPRTTRTESPLLSAYIDYEHEVRPGDYGVLVPGQQEEFSFQEYGNVVDDSSGVISTLPSESWICNYMGECNACEVQDNSRIWSYTLSHALLDGFNEINFAWYYLQELVDDFQASQFLINNIPLLQHVKSFEDLILVTKVYDRKFYIISAQEPESPESDIENGTTSISSLPIIYAREPDSDEGEVEFSQCPPNICLRGCGHWDSRIYVEETRPYMRIDYIRVRKEDLIKRFGFVPTVGRNKWEPCDSGPIIRSNRLWPHYPREYELVVQCSEPWVWGRARVSGEYP